MSIIRLPVLQSCIFIEGDIEKWSLVLLYFVDRCLHCFFWQLCCLLYFDIQCLIGPSVSSNSSLSTFHCSCIASFRNKYHQVISIFNGFYGLLSNENRIYMCIFSLVKYQFSTKRVFGDPNIAETLESMTKALYLSKLSDYWHCIFINWFIWHLCITFYNHMCFSLTFHMFFAGCEF